MSGMVDDDWMKLTEENVNDYVRGGGVKCPFCESENIVGGDREIDCGMTYQEVSCDGCAERWTDIYTLVGIYYKGNTITASKEGA